MSVRFKLNAAVMVLLALGFSSIATSQAAFDKEADPEVERTPDEIIVYGEKSVIILQNEFYRAEESFFDLFNTLNSSDEFDVACDKEQKSITERRKEHRCMPRFALNYAGASAGEFYRSGMQNSYSGMHSSSFATLEYQARARSKEKEMWAEVVELAKSNPEFRERIKVLQRTKLALDAEREWRLATQ